MKNPRFLRNGWAVIGSVGVIAGFGGLGKSTWWASEAALLSQGNLPGHHEGTPKSVLVMSAEDQWSSTIKPRLIAAGADLDRILYFETPSTDSGPSDIAANLSIPDDINEIREAVIANDVAWVILDPLVSFLSDDTDSHKDASTRKVLDPLNALATELGIAITGIMHFNKTNTTSAYDKLSGSSAFYNACRYVFLFGKANDAAVDDVRRFVVAAKHNMAKLPKSLAYDLRPHIAHSQRPGEEDANTSKLVLIGEADIAAHDLFTTPTSGTVNKQAQAEAILIRLLDTHAGVIAMSTYVEVAENETDASESTIRRAITGAGAQRFKMSDFDDKAWWIRSTDINDTDARKIAQSTVAADPLPIPF